MEWIIKLLRLIFGGGPSAADQKAVDAAAVQKQVEKANEVDSRVDAADDAELDRLRNKWTSPTAHGDP